MEDEQARKRARIKELLAEGVLVSPDDEALLTSQDELDVEGKALREKGVSDEALAEARVRAEKHDDPKALEKLKELAATDALTEKEGMRIIRNYTKKSKKYTYDDFVKHFNERFKTLSNILRQRQELVGATAITRTTRLPPRERVALIGMLSTKYTTKNNNIIFTLEDQTGTTKCLASVKNKELLTVARDLVLDEVIGVSGSMGEGIVFVNNIFLPDIPLTHELKKGVEEEHLVVVGDPQVGGKEFLTKDFLKLIAWLNGKVGNEEQKRLAAKVKYLVVIGDLVEGVGVYPGQEKDLVIKDIKAQYQAFAEYIKKIPGHIEILLIPGNHDAGRIEEPQIPIYKDFAPTLYEMPNVTLLSSPSLVQIGINPAKGFGGFTLLLYHGYSLPFYADNIPSVRERGGQKRGELIMKFLLQRRHLAPTHKSNLYIPDPDEDPLTITTIPDFFITGHIHRFATATYRGITMLNASCWCDETEDQVKRGLEPQPARLPVVNLQTREVKVINFYSGKGRGFLEEKGEVS